MPRHFHKAMNDPRYRSHHYREDTTSLEARIEAFFFKLKSKLFSILGK